MPRRKTPVSDEQREFIAFYGKCGYTAERIVALRSPELNGFREHIIREVLRSAGYISPARSRRNRGIRKMDPARKAEVEAFVKENAKTMTDRAMAKALGVSKGIVFRAREETVGKLGHKIRMSPEAYAAHSKRVRLFYATQRMKRFIKLLLLQQVYAKSLEAVPRTCSVCRRKWFKTSEFYAFNRNFNKYAAECHICKAEMNRLRAHGMPMSECRRIVAKFSFFPAKTDYAILGKRFMDDIDCYCTNPIQGCSRCRKQWYRNQNYFHTVRDEAENVYLLDVCLRCRV